MRTIWDRHRAGCWALGMVLCAAMSAQAHAGVASSVPAHIAAVALINNTVAVKGNPLTYSTQVPLSAGTAY